MAILEAIRVLTRSQGSGTFLAMPKSQLLQLTFEMALKMKYTTIVKIVTTREANSMAPSVMVTMVPTWPSVSGE